MAPLRRKLLIFFGISAVLGGAIGIFLSFGPPGLYAKSETPEFCSSCHVMESQYENWFHSGGHRSLKCIDCHLPNDNFPNHMTWKGLTGMWDMAVFYSGQAPEPIHLSARGAAMLQENCLRCHSELVSRINEDRNCWQCHRRLSHKTSGAL
jgi:cytochrome c nitrite reductase small subunit